MNEISSKPPGLNNQQPVVTRPNWLNGYNLMTAAVVAVGAAIGFTSAGPIGAAVGVGLALSERVAADFFDGKYGGR